jgi:myosin-crossreactive antigen
MSPGRMFAVSCRMDTRGKAWLVGGGIGSMAAAAFMIRDGGIAGADISIFEAAPTLGGSLDARATRWPATPCAAAAC